MNPAGLGTNDSVRISAYSARLFDQAELTQVSCEVDVRHIGLFMSTFGGSLYRESVVTAGAGSVTDGMAFGISVSLMDISVEGYGSSRTMGLNAGASGSVGSSSRVAVSARNLNLPAIGACTDDLPVDLECGLAATPWQGLFTCMSIRMESGAGPSVSGGVEFALGNSLFLRAGSNLASRIFGGGLGLDMSGFSLDYGVTIHDPLGLTHGISVCYTVSWR
jgi:hypothetical protein